MIKEFEYLYETIQDYCKGHDIYYFANPGNWGDALIRVATIHFFSKNNLIVKELTLTNRLQWIKPLLGKSVLIYGGGGAWCNNWNHAHKILSRKLMFFNKIVVLPSTYENNYQLPKTIFFRRDEFESKKKMPSSIFCHDMAFYYSPKPVKEDNMLDEAFYFRTDLEGRQLGEKYTNNIDITRDNNHFDDITTFIKLISKYKIINTDKLHVAVLAAKLDKEVNFYGGNYFKNKAVYLSSMKEYFPKVKFIEK